MFKYFVVRFLSIIPMLFLISIVIFTAMQLVPGDPLTFLIPPDVLGSSGFDLQAYKHAMGLDVPAYIQYFRWIGGVFQGNFGYSLITGNNISYSLSIRLPATMELATGALLISTVLGLLFGLTASIKQNSPIDYANTVVGIIGISVPDFFVGICMIQIFALHLKWLPTGGRLVYGATNFWQRLPNLVLPSLVLGFALTAALMRYTRGSMLDVLNKDYVKTARSKGLPEWKVITKHAFRNALMPVILLLCFRLPILIGGTIVIEQVFAWPGMGQLLLIAVSGKDYPVVMTITLMMASMILFASFLVDLLTALLDPRIRYV